MKNAKRTPPRTYLGKEREGGEFRRGFKVYQMVNFKTLRQLAGIQDSGLSI
jgi:hypothetical protein